MWEREGSGLAPSGPSQPALSSLTGGKEERQGGREVAGGLPWLASISGGRPRLALPQNIFLGFLEASRCWQSLTDLSFDVGASLSQSPASSHCPWISCGAVPSLNATSCPNTAHLPFNHLVGILFDHRKKKGRSVVSDSATPWTAAHQAPLSVGFSRQEYWSGVPLPSPITDKLGLNSDMRLFCFCFLVSVFLPSY